MDSNKIAQELQLEIDKYNNKVDFKSVGSVLSVGDGIAKVYGLDEASYGEVIKFSKKGVYGIVLSLDNNICGLILFGKYTLLQEGDEAYTTGEQFKTKVSKKLLGRVINALSKPLDGLEAIEAEDFYPIEREAPPMFARERVRTPLETGIKVIDGLIPIGRGQRELIIGNRHSGKSSIVIDTIYNQRDKGIISIYVAIGQSNSSIARMVDVLKSKDAFHNTIVVLASASSAASERFIAPYVGCAIAEYFMDQGFHTLVIYDDLTKHAIAYRELSILLGKPSGREAYPGDIFYIHSRLLERSAMLKNGSMTALPIVETQAGDVSAYIPTNIISITDGQIYLEESLFSSGMRPAINIGLSVSRVGGDAQVPAMRGVISTLKIALAQYKELQNFSQLSSDLDEQTKLQLALGEKIEVVLKQERFSPFSTEEQIAIFYALQNGYLNKLSKDEILDFQEKIKLSLKDDLKKKMKTLKISELKEDLDNFMRSLNV